jgi:hypothetical protein
MNLRPPHPNDANHDEPVDAHLRAALRHAPDADAAPPLALTEAILSQARAASHARPNAAPAVIRWSPLRGLRQAWLALSQPALATGLASVMVASVVGLMWWDRVPEEVGATAELKRETSKPEVQPALQLEARREVVAAPALPSPTPGPAPAPMATAKVADTTKAMPPAPSRTTASEIESKTNASSNTVEQRRAMADAAASHKSVTVLSRQAGAEATAPAAPAPLAGTASQRFRTEAAVTTADPSALERSMPAPNTAAPLSKPAPVVAAAPAALPAPAASTEGAVPRLPRSALGSAFSTSTAAPLTSLRQALQNEPERWAWQQNAGPAAPVVPAWQAWLDQVEAATGSRWSPRIDLPVSDKTARHLTLSWDRDGQTVHTLVLRPDGLLWLKAGTAEPAWFAPLDAATVKRLVDVLP